MMGRSTWSFRALVRLGVWVVMLGALAILACKRDAPPGAPAEPTGAKAPGQPLQAPPAKESAAAIVPPTATAPLAIPTAPVASGRTTGRIILGVNSVPNGAEARIGEEVLGTTPLRVSIPRGDDQRVLSLHSPGFEPRLVEIVPNRNLSMGLMLKRKVKTSKTTVEPSGGTATPLGAPSPAGKEETP